MDGVSITDWGVHPMRHPVPVSLLPGSWDDIVARAALKTVDWFYERLSRREPTLASAPLPADPFRRLMDWGGEKHERRAHEEADERPGGHRP